MITDTQPDVIEATEFAECAPIDCAALEANLGRLRKRLAIWEIFLGYAKDGACTWPELRRAITPADVEQISRICDGTPLREVMLGKP